VQATRTLDGVVKDLSIILQAHDDLSVPKETIELARIVESTKELLNGEMEAAQASINIELSNATKVTLIKPYFESILYNLLSNAIKYLSPMRALTIQIKARLAENKFFLSIEDNGLGIESENLDKIFEPYKRLTEEGEGKGLGLYLVRAHVEAMGGIIKVTSKLNQGTTFFLEIPQL
jgi:signal transduction histidine kinase